MIQGLALHVWGGTAWPSGVFWLALITSLRSSSTGSASGDGWWLRPQEAPGGSGGPRDTGRTVVRLARLPQENAEERMICSGLVLDL